MIALLLSVVNVGATNSNLALADAKRSDREAVETLLQQQLDVNAPEADGMTPLHWAVRQDDLVTADRLMRAGANVNAATRFGVTPLTLACTNGTAAMIEKLLKAGADANTASPEGETALMAAARTGKVDALKVLLAHGANLNTQEGWRGQTALMWSAAENHTAAMQLLIQAGADVHARSKGGFTPLLFAARAGHLAGARVLLAAGANANDKVQPAVATGVVRQGAGTDIGTDGSTGVALAIINAHYELAILLLTSGADPNAPDPRGSLLHSLAWMRRPGVGSAPPPRPTGTAESLDVARVLLERGAKPNVRIAWKERRVTNLRSEVQMPANISIGRNYISFVGATPFYLAAKHSDVAFMQLLVAHGADPLIPTVQGITPLMAAAGVAYWDGESAGPESGVSEGESLEAVKLAVELGNDVNAVADFGDVPVEGDPRFLILNNALNLETQPEPAMGDMRWSGSTVLHGAAVRGVPAIVQFLVDKGARLDAKNKLGWMPLTIAEGAFFAQTFKESPATAALLRQLMTERGLDPAQSMICEICGKRRAATQSKEKLQQ